MYPQCILGQNIFFKNPFFFSIFASEKYLCISHCFRIVATILNSNLRSENSSYHGFDPLPVLEVIFAIFTFEKTFVSDFRVFFFSK